jgi:hypothetical protein
VEYYNSKYTLRAGIGEPSEKHNYRVIMECLEVTEEWRKLHNGELHNLYASPDIIRQIKSRRMSWARHVARMGEGKNV